MTGEMILGYRFTLPGYDRRGDLVMVVPVAARLIGDDVSELYPYVAHAAAEEGYEIDSLRWEHREVEFVRGFAE